MKQNSASVPLNPPLLQQLLLAAAVMGTCLSDSLLASVDAVQAGNFTIASQTRGPSSRTVFGYILQQIFFFVVVKLYSSSILLGWRHGRSWHVTLRPETLLYPRVP